MAIPVYIKNPKFLHPETIIFKLYPEKKTLFFCVYIHPDKESMYKCVSSPPDTYGAICEPFDVIYYPPKKKGKVSYQRKRPICGNLHFYKGYLDEEVITHEISHATFAWIKRLKLHREEITDEDNLFPFEERFCYALGKMTLDFRRKFDKLKKL